MRQGKVENEGDTNQDGNSITNLLAILSFAQPSLPRFPAMELNGVYWWCTTCENVKYDPLEAIKRIRFKSRGEKHKAVYIK